MLTSCFDAGVGLQQARMRPKLKSPGGRVVAVADELVEMQQSLQIHSTCVLPIDEAKMKRASDGASRMTCHHCFFRRDLDGRDGNHL